MFVKELRSTCVVAAAACGARNAAMAASSRRALFQPLATSHLSHPLLKMESRCDRCAPGQTLFQCRECQQLDKTLKRSLKQQKSMANAKRACFEYETKQQAFLSIVREQFDMTSVPRNGHCLFQAFAAGYEKLKKGTKLQVQEMRDKVAQLLVDSGGKVLGFDIADDCFDPSRGGKNAKKKLSFEQYAEQVRGKLYGGDIEVAALAHLYDVAVEVYSWHFFHGSNIFMPQTFNASSQANGTVGLLFEQNFGNSTSREDHYDNIISDKFRKWREYMNAMPKWDINGTGQGEVRVCYSAGRGRGIQVLKDFKKGDVLLLYDGHRVDEVNGKLKVESTFLKDVYEKYSYDPESTAFHSTHALCVGRTHVTGLVIDGYHTTLEFFDDVAFMGRGAMANSANGKESNMIMKWVRSPHFPRDVVTKISDCDGFLIAKRDIK